MKASQSVLSRHRLPQRWRVSLTFLWLTPPILLMLVLFFRWQISLLDPRVLLPLLLMAVPAVYVWREGIDVLPRGIVRRVWLPRYYAYSTLETWYFDQRPHRHTLTIWDAHSRKIVECRAGHLTGLSELLKALQENVRWRNWPE